MVDLLIASCGIEPEIAEAAEEIEIVPGLVVPVATTAHLIAMKLLARDDDRRPQDASDLRALVEAASDNDIEDTRQAIELMTLRGFNRNRDLAAELGRLTRCSPRCSDIPCVHPVHGEHVIAIGWPLWAHRSMVAY